MGDPDLKLAGLSVWVHGREFENADDFWDGNWLNITARVVAPGAQVEAVGPWLRTNEVAAFLEELALVDRDLRGRAALRCLEPTISAEIECGERGQIAVRVELTPDQLAQQHRFDFELDQTYLRDVLAGCRRILDSYPVRGRS